MKTTDKDKEKASADASDRRTFLRKFLKKSAPIVVGSVAKTVARRPVASIAALMPTVSADSPKAESGPVPEEIKEDFEKDREKFIQDNPDFFEKP